MNQTKIIGVDIGGTSITAGLVVDGRVKKSISLATEPHKTKEEILQNLLSAICSVGIGNIEAIGIGVPGLVEENDGFITQITNIPAWNGYNLKQQIEKETGISTFIENDANCFVLGVKYFGQGLTYNNIIGITLGTGLGAGILIENKIYKGICNGAGEIGFIPYKDSNLEAYCSGSFFSKMKGVKGEEIFQKALLGDSNSMEIWEEYGLHISRLIRILLLCYAPEMIAFGGSLAKGFGFFQNAMNKNLESFELKSLLEQVKIVFVEDAEIAVKGSAALAFTMSK